VVLGLAYMLLRVVFSLAAGAVAARVAAAPSATNLGRRLLRPGVFGVAFALNAASVAGGDGSILLATVVVGTMASEIVALLLAPLDETE
jgi:hypothetical protein